MTEKRCPGWLLDEMRREWMFDQGMGSLLNVHHGYPPMRTSEIRRNAEHATYMLALTELAARKNADGERS